MKDETVSLILLGCALIAIGYLIFRALRMP